MATAWFCFLAVMVTIYVVLDGFDLGVGALHLFVAQDRGGARAGDGRDRPGLERQRGLADRGRRRAVHGLPEGLRRARSAASTSG